MWLLQVRSEIALLRRCSSLVDGRAIEIRTIYEGRERHSPKRLKHLSLMICWEERPVPERALKSVPRELSIYVSVLRKPWIWTIHGLSCANRGSRFERTNRGSLAQSVDVGTNRG